MIRQLLQQFVAVRKPLRDRIDAREARVRFWLWWNADSIVASVGVLLAAAGTIWFCLWLTQDTRERTAAMQASIDRDKAASVREKAQSRTAPRFVEESASPPVAVNLWEQLEAKDPYFRQWVSAAPPAVEWSNAALLETSTGLPFSGPPVIGGCAVGIGRVPVGR